jgi:hypothetical protein
VVGARRPGIGHAAAVSPRRRDERTEGNRAPASPAAQNLLTEIGTDMPAFRPGIQFTAVYRRVSARCYGARPSARRLEGIGPTSGHTLSDVGKLWLSQDFRPTAVPMAAVLRVATRSAPAMMMMGCPSSRTSLYACSFT